MLKLEIRIYSNNFFSCCLNRKSANRGCFTSIVVVWYIVIARVQNITILTIRESVSISLIQVAARSTWKSEIGNIGWCWSSWWPARLQSCSSAVCSVAINWITINCISNLSSGASSCRICQTASRNLCLQK